MPEMFITQMRSEKKMQPDANMVVIWNVLWSLLCQINMIIWFNNSSLIDFLMTVCFYYSVLSSI